jgi:hypothetical protein
MLTFHSVLRERLSPGRRRGPRLADVLRKDSFLRNEPNNFFVFSQRIVSIRLRAVTRGPPQKPAGSDIVPRFAAVGSKLYVEQFARWT